MTSLLTVIAVWLAVGLVQAPFYYAVNFAYFQRRYAFIAKDNYRKDVIDSVFLAVGSIVLGPIAFLPPFMAIGTKFFKYGMKWK